MAERLYGLTERTAGQLKQLLGDGGSIGDGATSLPAARGATWVKVTSGTPTSGWYPGVVSLDYNGTFTDLTAAVKIASSDGSALTNGNRYLCTRTGDDSIGARFRTLGTTSLTVQEADLTPSYTGTTTLRFDQGDGFELTQPSPGLVRVDMRPASETQTGVVNTDPQTFGGDKTFAGDVRVNGGLVHVSGDGATSPGGGAITLSYTGTPSGSIYCMGGTFYFVAGGPSGSLTDCYFQYVYATEVRLAIGGAYKVGASAGITANVTVKVGGVDKTAVFVGGILVFLA